MNMNFFKFFTKKNKAIDGELIEFDQNTSNLQVETDEKKVVRFGMVTLVAGLGGFLLWAALAPLDEGVPGSGIVSVDTKRKTIQHLRGGLVESIAVREGDRVKAGDILLRLNDTDVKAQLDIVRGQYSVVKAMESRLLAERDGRSTVTFPPDLLEAAKKDRRAAEAISAQGQLFAARKSALVSELGTMDEAIIGLQQQIIGLQSIESGKKTQIDLINKELNSFRGLVEEGFVPRNKLYELERVLADLSGTRGGDLAQVARAQASINEAKLRKLQRVQDFRKEVETQMSEVQKEVGSQSDRLIALTEEFERAVIKAPTDGSVVGLEAHTVGGVIRPGDRIMDIVPEGDVLVVEAQLPVNLIDKVEVGQLANLHLQIILAGGAQPSIEGRVSQVSADRLTDPRTGMPYYSARIQITEKGEAELRRNKIKAQPGMQVDVVIITGERTVLQYLLKPLMSRVNSGMKEQ
ncbi:MAG: HlyD family type I secretion periplasmic adaptor subunit [Azonexus sp.]|nr:HlyD family type I secretion periplasmic adaptor subunit [Azonexus sp.]MDZ4315044.1 HlyD family type I secretion periplasmic adaptor subunit [Azonexus sp.]